MNEIDIKAINSNQLGLKIRNGLVVFNAKPTSIQTLKKVYNEVNDGTFSNVGDLENIFE